MTDSGDLLLYGCNVGAGASGQQFVESLAQLTGADVAASDDVTGGVAVGGDWELESVTGLIESVIPVGDVALQQYDQSLGAVDDYILAKMSLVAYYDNPAHPKDSNGAVAEKIASDAWDELKSDGWSILEKKDGIYAPTDYPTHSTAVNSGSGFAATAFKKDNSIVIAYRGTNEAMDWIGGDTAIGSPLPAWGSQFEDAILFAFEIKNQFYNSDIEVTGHSLGGGLAQVVSKMFGFSGATFDPGGSKNIANNLEFNREAYIYTGSLSGALVPNGFINYLVEASPISGIPLLTKDHLGATDTLKEGELRDFLDHYAENHPIKTSLLEIMNRPLTLAALTGIDYVFYSHAMAGILEFMCQKEEEDGINYYGTSKANTISANNSSNVIDGYDGNDTISGNGGNDTIDGGSGNDTAIFSGNFAEYSISLDKNSLVFTVADRESGRDGTDQLVHVESFKFDNGTWKAGDACTVVNGSYRNEYLFGNDLNNRLLGGGGDDVLEGKKGNDTIDGGSGTDAVIFTGTYAEYVITPNADQTSFTIRDTVAGRDGTDLVSGVEQYRFGEDVDVRDVTNLVDGGGGGTGTGGGGNTVSANRVSSSTKLFPGHTMGEFENMNAFAALREDGSVVTWGYSYWGGNSSAVADELNGDVDVVQVFSTNYAFAALREDGSVVTWGYSSWGGNSSAVSDELNGAVDVVQVFSTDLAFAALREDGSVVTWGGSDYGGNSSAVSDKLHDVVAISDIYSNGSQERIFSGTDGNDNLTGTYASDILWGNGGNDVLAAMGGNDLAFGGSGNDLLIGGEGEGDDIYVGGEGVDTVKYTSALAGITVDLVEGTAYSTDGNDAAAIGTDVLIDIENVIAGNFNDILIGNSFANSLEGGAGDDWLQGGEGVDTLDGGLGSDTADYSDKMVDLSVTLNGAVDAIVMVGGVAEDTIRNIENLVGGEGNDTFIGDSADNLFLGGAGNDTLDGGSGSDMADYSDKTEAVSVTLHGSLDAIVTVGGVAEDTIRNIENLIGGSGNDTLIGDALANSLSGGYGDDTLQGGAGNDTLDGGADADTMVFRGNLAQYSLTYNFDNQTYTVTDSLSGRDGSDLVTGAEFFQFADGVHAVADLIDIVPPYLQAMSPAEYATNVAIGADIVFTFTEPVQAGTGNMVISNGSDDIRTIAVTDSSQVTISGNTLTINPSEDLAIDQEYTVSIPSGTVVDFEENGFQGFTSSSFTTGSSGGFVDMTFNTTGTVEGSPMDGENYYTFSSSEGVLAEIYDLSQTGINWFFLDLTEDSDGDPATFGVIWNWLDQFEGISSSRTGVITFQDTVLSAPGPELWSMTFSTISPLLVDGTLNSSLDGLPDGFIVKDYQGNPVNVPLTWQAKDSNNVIAVFSIPVKDQQNNNTTLSGSVQDTNNDNLPDRMVGSWGSMTFDYSGGSWIDSNGDGKLDQMVRYEILSGRVQVDGSGNPAGLYMGPDILMITATGSNGADWLYGGSGNDSLYGVGGNDSLYGEGGNDLLDGGTGSDMMLGGAGDDTYVVDSAGDIVTENSDEGTDTVQSSVTCTLGANVENLTLTGTGAINGTGNTLNNLLIGNSGSNTLNGGVGNDTMQGGAGNDTYVVDSSSDVVTEAASAGTDRVQSSVTYTLSANVENLTLNGTASINGTGNTLSNTLVGNSGNNILDGGAGNDTMQGGLGNDTYVVDSTGDVVTEAVSAGTDTVSSSVTYTLSANVENLTLTGTAGINGTGNTLANFMIGSTGNNIISGGAGNDTMQGGAGNDTYVVDSTGDVVIENPDEGTDTISSSVTCTLGSNIENLALAGAAAINGTGNSLANILAGNSGNNILDGGVGNDTMQGGVGNDTYIVDSTGDVVTEATSAGTDTVQSSVTYTLGVNIENLTLTGATAINGTGNILDNLVTGNTGNNNLSGGLGNDTLDGGVGNDTMQGGGGDDTFIVDSVSDVVTEATSAGTDTVLSSVTYTLAANIENLTLTGIAAINGTGNILDNVILGNSGNNILDGGAGTDSINGGEGSDLYLVGLAAHHAAAEFADTGVTGSDEVRFTSAAASTLKLYAGDTGIEKVVIGTGIAAAAVTTATTALNVDATEVTSALWIIGNAGANSLTGTGSNDTLDGGAGNDSLTGGNGDDFLIGGNGNDTLTGGNGNDHFVFNFAPNATTNKDTIIDFEPGTDELQFSKAIFTKLGSVGELTAAEFWSGTAARDTSDRIIYNESTGALYYDADGTGAIAAVQVAIIGTATHPVLQNTDIHIIA